MAKWITVLLLFLCFLFSLLFADGMLQWVLSVMSLLFLFGFAIFAVMITIEEHIKLKKQE